MAPAHAQAVRHRHRRQEHSHRYDGPHAHRRRDLWRPSVPVADTHSHGRHNPPGEGKAHAHSHGLVDDSIKRSQEGVRAVSIALAVLGAGALVQAFIFIASGSIALLADLVHNAGDALTALPLGTAFVLRSRLGERLAGVAVVCAIFISACVAGTEAVARLLHLAAPSHLVPLALAGAAGWIANLVAARIRTAAGRRLESPALIADGEHARADAYVSLAVVASAAAVACGLRLADPLIGLAITLVILRITWRSWHTLRTDGNRPSS